MPSSASATAPPAPSTNKSSSQTTATATTISSSSSPSLVQFQPFRSIPDPSFFLQHNSVKLNILKLQEDGLAIFGYFASSSTGANGLLPPPGMRFDSASSYFRKNHRSTIIVSSTGISATKTLENSNLNSNNNNFILQSNRKNEYIRSSGTVSSINTLESFKNMNKNTFLNQSSLPLLLRCCGILKHYSLPRENNDDGVDVTRDGGDKVEEQMDNPNAHLVSTTCILHTNLKSNIVVYWFAFPALIPRPGCGIAYSSSFNTTARITKEEECGGQTRQGGKRRKCQQRLMDVWGAQYCRMLSNSFHSFRVRHERKESMKRRRMGENEVAADAAQRAEDEVELFSGEEEEEVWCPPFFLLLPPPSIEDDDWRMTREKKYNMKCLPLNEATYNSLSEKEKQDVIFTFVDPTATPPRPSASSTIDDENEEKDAPYAVGWTLRNLVAYVSLRLNLGGCERTFLSYRCPFLRRIDLSSIGDKTFDDEDDDREGEEDGMRDSFEDVSDDNDDAGVGGSLLLDIAIPLAADYKWPCSTDASLNSNPTDDDYDTIVSSYRCVGWELNKNNKPGPRSIDLRPLVSPAHLLRQANDLNLRLMKWRALPSLNVKMLSNMRVLLLGAGTLGCGVARTLLGWGVRNITFVDSGRVSYSNPVRQSLFGIDDCKDGGRYKATAAAASLITIAGPDVKSEGVVLAIAGRVSRK